MEKETKLSAEIRKDFLERFTEWRGIGASVDCRVIAKREPQDIEEMLLWFTTVLEQAKASIIEEVIKNVQINHKGTFTDEGGNDCWYIEDLVKALQYLKEELKLKDEK